MHTLIAIASSALINAQFLPQYYPQMDVIPPVLPDIVATVNWQNAVPAVVVTDCTVPNTWALSYDDGPSAYTPQLLDYLKANNIKATFFVVGSRVRTQAAVLQRAYAEGHQVILQI